MSILTEGENLKKTLSFDVLENKILLSTSPTADVVVPLPQADIDLFFIQWENEMDAQKVIKSFTPITAEVDPADVKEALAPMIAPTTPLAQPGYIEVFMNAVDQVLQIAVDSSIPIFHP